MEVLERAIETSERMDGRENEIVTGYVCCTYDEMSNRGPKRRRKTGMMLGEFEQPVVIMSTVA